LPSEQGVVRRTSSGAIIAAITLTEAANGFGNRFLFTCVKRSKLLPFGGEPDRDTMSELEFRLAERLNAAIDRNPARPPRVLGFDQPATELWCQIYGTLSAPTPGLLGAVIARAEAQVVRLALVYALLDGAEAIGQVHLEAALELWIYCEDSAGTWMMYMDNLTTKAQQRFLPAAKVKSLISIHPGSLMGEQTRCI